MLRHKYKQKKQAVVQMVKERKQADLEKQTKAEINQMPSVAKQFLLNRYPSGEKQDFSPQPQDRQFIQQVEEISKVWVDNLNLASHTARIALPNVVTKLQDDKRKLEKIQATPCVTFAQSYLYASMDSTIEGFLAFMDKNDSMASFHSEVANKSLNMFKQKINECQVKH